MAVKILAVIGQNTALTLLYNVKCLINKSHSVSHKAEACLQFPFLPKVSIYSHQHSISILTSVEKSACLLFVSKERRHFVMGCVPIVSLQSVEEHLV